MDYAALYQKKLTSAAEAVKVIKSGDWVDYGWAIGTPVSFDAALAKRLPELHGIKFRGGILCHVPEILQDRKSGRALLLEQLAYGRH